MNLLNQMPKYSEIELTRREFDPYDGGWRNYAPIIIHLENELSIDDKICTIADHIEDTWSIQRKDLDMDYLALFFMFNHKYSQSLCDERKIKNDSGVWMDIKDYIWIRKIAG